MHTEQECEFRDALANRNADYDGRFVFAVKTTGIYCKPSCASRAPKPGNVRFFAGSTEAQAAGFRACKRCRPDAAPTLQPIALAMQALADFIESHADESLPLTRLASYCGFSASHLQRSFRAVHGMSPKAFQSAIRLRDFKAHLRAGDRVIDAMNEAGFGSSSRLYAQADGQLGMSPSAYRAHGAGELIHYALRPSSLGMLLMAATARGVCFVHFGDDEESLVLALKNEYPRAELQAFAAQKSVHLDQWMDAMEAHLCGAAVRPDLPLDIRGSAFQLRVWRYLMGLEAGRVVSYSEAAQGIGAPKAIRAAASACAANNIAVLIPCHRVLRGDGSLGGYRWGVERKRVLIERERAAHRD